MSEPIIKLEHVNFWYNKGKAYQMQAIKDINIEIERGEYVAFFGPSGSGKTTLLYLISGVEPSQDGKIMIRGRDISKFSNKELAIYRQIGVGIVFQQFNLINNLTVLNNVALPMSFLGISEKKREEEARKILKRLAIDHLADRYPDELSGGQQQRVGIARALANNAPIIIADEPLGNLDSENSKKVLEFLKELHDKDNRTIIMVTHEAWSLRDVGKIFYVKDGEIVKTEKITPENVAKSVEENLISELIPHKTPTQVISSSIASQLLQGYMIEEVERFQGYVDQRLKGEIKADEFLALLDKPYKSGGMGLWKQKARKISQYIESVISKRSEMLRLYKELGIETKEEKPKVVKLPVIGVPSDYEESEMDIKHREKIEKTIKYSDESELVQLRNWLLEDYSGKPSRSTSSALDKLLVDRLKKTIKPEEFARLLSETKKRHGLGLSIHTAKRIVDKLDLVLSQ